MWVAAVYCTITQLTGNILRTLVKVHYKLSGHYTQNVNRKYIYFYTLLILVCVTFVTTSVTVDKIFKSKISIMIPEWLNSMFP